jgi:hypothetical protein
MAYNYPSLEAYCIPSEACLEILKFNMEFKAEDERGALDLRMATYNISFGTEICMLRRALTIINGGLVVLGMGG